MNISKPTTDRDMKLPKFNWRIRTFGKLAATISSKLAKASCDIYVCGKCGHGMSMNRFKQSKTKEYVKYKCFHCKHERITAYQDLKNRPRGNTHG